MDALPPCCHKAAKQYEELGYNRMAATAKALRDHATGHADMKQLGK